MTAVRFPEGPDAVETARIGLQAFVRLAGHWALTVDQQRRLLGDLPNSTYYAIRKGTHRSASGNLLERLSLLLGIWADLELLVPNPEASVQWLKRPHPGHRFGTGSPLDWMLQGTVAALTDVRRYLGAWKSGW
jgi:hypothetical protein